MGKATTWRLWENLIFDRPSYRLELWLKKIYKKTRKKNVLMALRWFKSCQKVFGTKEHWLFEKKFEPCMYFVIFSQISFCFQNIKDYIFQLTKIIQQLRKKQLVKFLGKVGLNYDKTSSQTDFFCSPPVCLNCGGNRNSGVKSKRKVISRSIEEPLSVLD